MQLKDCKALVTGGGTGIGKGIAAALKAEGAQVCITGRRKQTLDAAARELGVEARVADVSIEKEAEASVEEFVKRHGRIDLLVNNAGQIYFAPLLETEAARFEEIWRTNVLGAMLMARAAARHFVKQNSGHLVNIASTSGLKGQAGATAYGATKFALRGMSECWRDELRRHNVRVICVNPSEVILEPERQRKNPRKLRPEEIAAAILGALKMDDRGFLPEFAVFATNPF